MTPTWMEGYASDIEYTTGYYREQEPEHINLSAVLHGIEPVSTDDSFTYCELGCGLGLTSLIMAANYPQGEFWAVDYNPSHITQAQHIAEQAGLNNIHFMEVSFEDIANDKTLLPTCDFITFHGIYSWISDENREHLVSICKQHLKSGGLVYNSYNAQPGWAASKPLQKALNTLSQTYKGSSLERFQASRDFLNRFAEQKPRYFEINDKVLAPRLERLQQTDLHYLVHEYLNDGWDAFHCHDVMTHFSQAKMDYVGLANPAEAYANDLMPVETRQLLAEHESIRIREMFKDMTYNTAFRKELYARGGRRITMAQQIAWLKQKKWLPLTEQNIETFKFTLSVGEVTGKQGSYQQVLEALRNEATDLAGLEKATELTPKDLVQILMLLYSGNLIAMQHDTPNDQAIALNKSIVQNANTAKNHFVAAASIGTAVNLNPLDLNFLKLHSESSEKTDAENNGSSFAQTLYELFETHNLNLTHQGDTYVGDAMQTKLIEMEQAWRDKSLPLWTKLGIV